VDRIELDDEVEDDDDLSIATQASRFAGVMPGTAIETNHSSA
jgi:hypothetical protein